MPDITERQILDALRKVEERDRGRDVVSLGMISGIVVKDGNVGFSIEVSPEEGQKKEPLRQACEDAVRALPGVLSVTAVLTAERPRQAASGGQREAPQQPAAATIPGINAIVAVASGKGGVGKSTVAANLALGMALNGLRVGILDADIYGPSMPRMLGVRGKPEAAGGRSIRPMENYGVKIMSMGFLVEEETPMIWRGPMVQSALEQMLREVAWGELDVLVVDMPPGTGDAQLTMAQRVPLAGAVIVSTPQDIALLDARKGLNMFQRVDVPVFGIVENMSYYLCPSCGHRAEIFGHGGAHETAEKLGVDFLGEIPLHLDIRTHSDEGKPIVVVSPESEQAKAFRAVADRVADKVMTASGARKPPRIVVS